MMGMEEKRERELARSIDDLTHFFNVNYPWARNYISFKNWRNNQDHYKKMCSIFMERWNLSRNCKLKKLEFCYYFYQLNYEFETTDCDQFSHFFLKESSPFEKCL